MALKQVKKNDYFQDMRNIDEHTMEEDIELHEYKQKKAQKKKQEVVTQSYNEVYQQSNEFSRQNEEDIQIIDTQIEEDDQTSETLQTNRMEKMAGSTLQKLKDKLRAAFIKEQEQKAQNTDEIQDSRRLKNKKRDFIDDCKLNFESNLYPQKLGKMYCFWYNSKYQPRIVLGPDWTYTLIELVIVNSLAGAFILTIDRVAHEWLFSIGLATLMTQNFTFLMTSLANPGLPPRDIKQHSESYLNKVKILKPQLYCSTCKVIYQEDRESEHCEDCDYCIEELDHHCAWSSKCIGRNNMTAFKSFLFMTVSLIVYLFAGGMFALASN